MTGQRDDKLMRKIYDLHDSQKMVGRGYINVAKEPEKPEFVGGSSAKAWPRDPKNRYDVRIWFNGRKEPIVSFRAKGAAVEYATRGVLEDYSAVAGRTLKPHELEVTITRVAVDPDILTTEKQRRLYRSLIAHHAYGKVVTAKDGSRWRKVAWRDYRGALNKYAVVGILGALAKKGVYSKGWIKLGVQQ